MHLHVRALAKLLEWVIVQQANQQTPQQPQPCTAALRGHWRHSKSTLKWLILTNCLLFHTPIKITSLKTWRNSRDKGEGLVRVVPWRVSAAVLGCGNWASAETWAGFFTATSLQTNWSARFTSFVSTLVWTLKVKSALLSVCYISL